MEVKSSSSAKKTATIKRLNLGHAICLQWNSEKQWSWTAQLVQKRIPQVLFKPKADKVADDRQSHMFHYDVVWGVAPQLFQGRAAQLHHRIREFRHDMTMMDDQR